jgi:hypothetical protein
MTLTINPAQVDATSGLTLHVELLAAATTVRDELRPRGIPFAIPRSQLYYWTRTWQEGEAAALADLAAGRSQVFDDPRELARYLLRPED